MKLLALALVAASAAAAPDLTLRYSQPAPDTAAGWEKEALPIGNGRIGAMIFGQLARERLQFNDITLWTGDEKEMGAFQPFGDVYIHLPGHEQGTTAYARRLDISRSVHTVTYTHNGVQFKREALASYPAQVIALRLTASKRGQYTGAIELTDMHGAKISAQAGRIVATGALPNAMQYASQVQVLNEGGKLTVEGSKITFTGSTPAPATAAMPPAASRAKRRCHGWPRKSLPRQTSSQQTPAPPPRRTPSATPDCPPPRRAARRRRQRLASGMRCWPRTSATMRRSSAVWT